MNATRSALFVGSLALATGCAGARHMALHESAGKTIRSTLERADLPKPDLLAEAIEWFTLGDEAQAKAYCKKWIAQVSSSQAAAATKALQKLGDKLGPAKAGLRPVLAMLSTMPDDGTAGLGRAVASTVSRESGDRFRALLADSGLGPNANKLSTALVAVNQGKTEDARILVESWRQTATPVELQDAAKVLGRLGAAVPSMEYGTNRLVEFLATPATPTPAPSVAASTQPDAHPVATGAASGPRLGEEGESCTRTAECVDPLGCIAGVCRPRARDVERDRVTMLAVAPTEVWPCAALVSALCDCDRSPAGTGRCAEGIDVVNATVSLEACLVAIEPKLAASTCGNRAAMLAARTAFTAANGGKLTGVRPEAARCGQQVRDVCTCAPVGPPAVQRETCRMGTDAVLAAAAGQAAPACTNTTGLSPETNCKAARPAATVALAPVAPVAPPAPPPPAAAPESAGVPCAVGGRSTVKFRAEASHVAPTTGTALPGTELTCFETKGTWRRVAVVMSGVRGYLPENYVRLPAPATVESAVPAPVAAAPSASPTSGAHRPPPDILRATCQDLYTSVMVRQCGATAPPAAYVDACAQSFCAGTDASTCALEMKRTCNWDRILHCPACR